MRVPFYDSNAQSYATIEADVLPSRLRRRKAPDPRRGHLLTVPIVPRCLPWILA